MMALSDAQRKASNAYRKKTKTVALRFYPNSEEDAALYAWLKSKENATAYIKALVAADMARGKRA